ncbi:hypothetical protein DKM44_14050 [Deinococcus irradiatisoli]|uniref:Uncharacterized protein n=1 Tax=Deinococcus irradiatisoli TaxID=2202254 RepID=A0A2Z3JUJ5_9DEIO|nr:hypothetical protein [Deinococcus irradiatisoli]AWN24214.1 hypothetical protein DKM44_14050 [Deinococcus irradiatisoli]
MEKEQHSVSFSPGHAQFVVYDVQAEYDVNQDPLWSRPNETATPLSSRLNELAIGLLADEDLTVVVEVGAQQPSVPEGTWDVQAQASLSVPSGMLGIRDVVQDDPVLVVPVPPGLLNVGISGRLSPEEQLFLVQVWPVGTG